MLRPTSLYADIGNSILCGDIAIKSIEEPFLTETDDQEEWAI